MAVVVNDAREIRYGFTEQTVWGTIEADNSAVTEMDCEHVDIALDTKVREGNAANGTRNPIYADRTIDTTGSMANFTVASPVKMAEIDFFLYGIFQNVTEGITPFDKTFTFPSTQPDFSTSDAGSTLTWWNRYPVSSTTHKVKDVVCKGLTLSCERDGYLKMSAEMVGRGTAVITGNPSGTWTRTAQSFLHFEDLDVATINWGAGAQSIVLQSFEIKLGQEVVGVGADGSGSFSSYGLINRAHTFSVTFLKDAQFESALTNLQAGTAITGRIGWGNATPGTDDGDFDIAWTGKIIDKTINTDGVIGGTITGEILASTSATEPITIIMANGQNRGW